MPFSSWAPWDLYNSKELIADSSKGLYLFSFFDSFVERIFLSRITEAKQFKVIVGSEVNQDWIDENFHTLSLFGDENPILILQAEMIDKRFNDELLKIENVGRLILFSFTGESDLFDSFKEKSSAFTCLITPPKFWENKKILSLFCRHFKIAMDYHAEEFFLDAVPPTSADYFNELSNLAISFPDKKILSLSDIKDQVTLLQVNFFDLADLLSKKNFNEFWKLVIGRTSSRSDLEMLFNFLVSHLEKLLDPSFIKKKKGRLTKYDTSIEVHAKSWNKNELSQLIGRFRQVLIELRYQWPEAKNVLEREHLKSYYS